MSVRVLTRFKAEFYRVNPDGNHADRSRLREYNIPYIDYGEDIHEIRGLTGTNMSFTRQVLDKVGFFDSQAWTWCGRV